MGSSECYCAICSGPLGDRFVSLGSISRGHLKRRGRRVSRNRQAKETGQDFDVYASDSEHDSDHYSDDEEIDYFVDDWSYDPRLVSMDRIEWLNDYRALGLNLGAVGGAKAYISGQACGNGQTMVDVQQGEDPNQPPVAEKRRFNCYCPWDGDPEVVFPFHPQCMVVLEKAHKWFYARLRINEERLNLEVLYCNALYLAGTRTLELNNGGISPEATMQAWGYMPGEEFSVITPLELLPLDLLLTAEQNVAPFRNRVPGIDPFQRRPMEIVQMICRYLDGDLRAFLTVSPTAYSLTQDPAFWKSLCMSRLGWAWEVWEGQDTGVQDHTKMNYRRIYLRLEKHTSKPFGLTVSTRPWMGIMNRRRIWNACVELLEYYSEGKTPGGNPWSRGLPSWMKNWEPTLPDITSDVATFLGTFYLPRSSG